MDARQARQNLGRGQRLLAGKTKLSKLDDDASTRPLSPVRIASLRNTREALLLGYCEGWLHEMEFLALYELNTSENLEFPYDSYDQFNLDDIDEAECIAEFRFEKRHILRLEQVLQIPALLKCA